MQIEFLEQFVLYASTYAVTKEGTVRHDDRSARRPASERRIAMQLAHDQLQEQQCRFRSLTILGKVPLNSLLFLATERRIGDDHIDPIPFADFGELETQGVSRIDMRCVETVQQKIHLTKEIRK